MFYVYVSVQLCCSTEISNFDGSDSDRIMFLDSVEQLRMNTNILRVIITFTLLHQRGSMTYYEK
jgi:hypothetical protein